MSDTAPIAADAIAGTPERVSALPDLFALPLRYFRSSIGPISVSGAHFLAALIFLHTLPRAEFGLFSFVFVVVSFCFSMSGALIGVSLVNSANRVEPMSASELGGYMKVNAIFSICAGAIIFVLLCGAGADTALAAITGLYGGLMTLRWFARSYAYATHTMPRAIVSDVAYSAALLGLLGGAAVLHALTPIRAGGFMVLSATGALFAFKGEFWIVQARAVISGSLHAFAPAWRDLARWSALGVVTTEASANAHAYLVTFIAGPEAFALLAVGALFMRPVSLVLTAIPDAERPAMARAMSQNNVSAAIRTLTQFRMAGLAVLSGAVALAAVIMIWFPRLVMKHGYDKASVVAVIGIWILVMSARAIRTPESVFLQVVGEYRSLAGASLRSSVVSMLATLVLLLTFGPVVSLLGILFGELVAAQRIFSLTREWRAQNG
jgi:putative peptidoglycan lipid II flippase